MSATVQCPTCEMVITESDSEECIPNVQTEEQTRKVKLDPKIIHEVEPLSGKFHDREAQQKALSDLESARTHFDSSKLRISFNR
ncbi:hypothetical protein E4H12_01435 [Candidatus Thorarchaeota archaeon]|nr:hypothetical protein [Candidatus Thorarchaeota archaeon]TFG99819.1 MAG: hypothetical protein E4H12_01435 [Candidatus Thorarchaeota archaeon]